MNRPSVIILDKDFHSIADLTDWVDDFQKSYHWMDPKSHKDTFGFSNQSRPQSSRVATVEFRHHPIAEKLLACKNEKVYAAFVVDGRLSRWEMFSVSVVKNGQWTMKFNQMNPYTEGLLREMLAVGAKHLTKQENPEPTPTPAPDKPKPKKRSHK